MEVGVEVLTENQATISRTGTATGVEVGIEVMIETTKLLKSERNRDGQQATIEEMKHKRMKGLIEAATEMRLLWVTTMDVRVTIIEEDKVETQVKCSQRVLFTKVCNYSIDLYSLVQSYIDS